MTSNKKNILIKKLLYQSNNRGFKETCLILSNFSKKYLNSFSLKELNDFAIMLNYNDSDLYSWLTKNSIYPSNLNQKLMDLLINNNKK